MQPLNQSQLNQDQPGAQLAPQYRPESNREIHLKLPQISPGRPPQDPHQPRAAPQNKKRILQPRFQQGKQQQRQGPYVNHDFSNLKKGTFQSAVYNPKEYAKTLERAGSNMSMASSIKDRGEDHPNPQPNQYRPPIGYASNIPRIPQSNLRNDRSRNQQPNTIQVPSREQTNSPQVVFRKQKASIGSERINSNAPMSSSRPRDAGHQQNTRGHPNMVH